MKIIKKIGIITFSILTIFTINLGYCLRLGPITEKFDGSGGSAPIMNGSGVNNINEGSYSFTKKLEGILEPYEKTHFETTLAYVTALIQITINWLLGILAFVSLVYMLYCGFLVFSSGSDDKNASKGKKGISTAAIALAGIGISWLIISAMIRFINLISNS